MRRKFVAKRRKKKNYKKIKILVILLAIYIVYQIGSSLLVKIQLTTNNEDFLLAMMKDSNHYMLYEQDQSSFLTKLTKLLTGIDMEHPTSTLETVFHYEEKPEKKQVLFVKNDTKNEEVKETKPVEKETSHIKDPSPKKIKDVQVYLYNTHQLENYSMKNLEPYNITPNVMMASYLLKEKLNNAGIGTIVEEANINEFMKLNKWTSKDTYKASKQFMSQALKKYPELDLLIDIHRDAIPKASSTITIGGKNYAKVLFVVGMDHKNYQKNMDLSKKISDAINQKYPKLSRGVLPKKGAGVNGVYNQDVSEKVILIECGGYENTIDEVSNTIEALSVILKDYLEGIY